MTKTTSTIPSIFNSYPSFGARSVGFDHLFDMMDKLATTNIPSYPPYNIIRIAPDQYQIVIAAAGFSKDDITINKIKNELHVKSQSNEERADQKDIVYIHKGLATRDFTLKFNLADDVEVVEANFENGLLKIELQHTLPEEEKPKRIPIF